MAVRTDARYTFGILWVRFMALNDDLTIPTPDRIMGGAGPFDYSGAAVPGAVPMSVKIDNGAVETINVNVAAAAADISAVTVAELVIAITAAAFTDITASADVGTGRLLIEYSGTETVNVLQVYGLCATLARIGQGFGCEFIRSNTVRELNVTPVRKDEERITTTDAQGKDTEVVTDGYRKGCTIAVIDTADDVELLALIEGGDIDATTGEYSDPTAESEKLYFYIEAFYGMYSEGENKEADMVAVQRRFYRSCKGFEGDNGHSRGWTDGNYNVTCTSYKDENEDIFGASTRKELSIEDWEALDVANV